MIDSAATSLTLATAVGEALESGRHKSEGEELNRKNLMGAVSL